MFIRYELRPVLEQHPADDERGKCTSYRTRSEWEVARQICERENIPCVAFWSIYGVDEKGLSTCIGDYDEEQDALAIFEAMLALPRKVSALLSEGRYLARSEARDALGPMIASAPPSK